MTKVVVSLGEQKSYTKKICKNRKRIRYTRTMNNTKKKWKKILNSHHMKLKNLKNTSI